MGLASMVTIAIAIANPPSDGGSTSHEDSPLRIGIARYEAEDYGGALRALTVALDQAPKGPSRAIIHAYVGLIQMRYGLGRDAARSFRAALKSHRRVRLPDPEFEAAHQLFRRVRRRTGVAAAKRRRGRGKTPATRDDSATSRQGSNPPQTEPPRAMTPRPPADSLSVIERRAASQDGRQATSMAPSAEKQSEAPRATGARQPRRPAPAARTAPLDLRARPAPSSAVNLRTEPEPEDTNVAAWMMLSVGAASVVTGVVFEGLAIANQRTANNAASASRTAELTDTFQTQEQVGWVSIGVGAALVVGAAVWLALD